MKNYSRLSFLILAFISLFSVSYTAMAAPVSSPIALLQTTSDQMISALNAHKSTLKSDPSRVFTIVDRILLPHIDMDYMSKSVVGRSAWMSADPQTRTLFTKQFTELLTRTYASALAAYTNQTVTFYPIRGGYENLSQVTVSSEIIQPTGPAVPMTYILLRENNQWKVIDFSVDNVSIVNNFKAQFASDLDQGSLATLTQKLKTHNQALAQQESTNGQSQ